MVLSDWFNLMLLVLTLIKPKISNESISVGNDFNCHYQPGQLYDAMQKHEKLYLSNDFVIQSLKINNTHIHLIGGYDDCDDIKHGLLSQQRTVISGNNESVAISIDTRANQSVTLENFEIKDGRAEEAGGIAVFNTKSLTVVNSLIYQNEAMGSGGGIHLIGDTSEVHILGSKIYRNQAIFDGGGIAISGHGNLMELIDSGVYSNQADKAGGGISCINHNLINTTFAKQEFETGVNKNQAPLGDNVHYELTCQFWWNSEQSKSVLKS